LTLLRKRKYAARRPAAVNGQVAVNGAGRRSGADEQRPEPHTPRLIRAVWGRKPPYRLLVTSPAAGPAPGASARPTVQGAAPLPPPRPAIFAVCLSLTTPLISCTTGGVCVACRRPTLTGPSGSCIGYAGSGSTSPASPRT